MRIILQDGSFDVSYDNLSLRVSGSTIYAYSNICTASVYAVYSTPEKAKEAMRLLHEAYSVKVSRISTWQFPSDDEVAP